MSLFSSPFSMVYRFGLLEQLMLVRMKRWLVHRGDKARVVAAICESETEQITFAVSSALLYLRVQVG